MMLDTECTQYLSDGTRVDTHMGEIYCSLADAQKYAQYAVKEGLCNRFVVGVFVLDAQQETTGIMCVETFGFRNDKRNPLQLEFFKK